MFRKTQTTVRGNSQVEQVTVGYLTETAVPEDMARVLRELRNNRGSMGRVLTTEKSMTTLLIMYTSGTVVVFNYVAE